VALPAPASAAVLLLAPPAVVPSAPASEPDRTPSVVALPAQPPVDPHREHALRQIDALEQWLAAVDAARPDRNA
jgi:hypothetical protein